jgi:hypothetical protein
MGSSPLFLSCHSYWEFTLLDVLCALFCVFLSVSVFLVFFPVLSFSNLERVNFSSLLLSLLLQERTSGTTYF